MLDPTSNVAGRQDDRQALRAATAWVEQPAPVPRGREHERRGAGAAAIYADRYKRWLDVGLSVPALVAFLPVLLLLALVIKLDSRGPVFYRQVRIGVERRRRREPHGLVVDRRRVINPGRPFEIVKLRTMTQDAEAGGPQWATPGDARVTRVGRVLRRYRLDEVPQFVNVLRGEMSVIGPRPERLCFIRELADVVPGYYERLAVLPGITGLAQVVNGYDTDVESVRRKVGLDRQYVGSVCWRTDLRIAARTFKVLVAGREAR
jgi:lipopolysaccharide/colanic/teichoic acid biosynthesis glycosyltransferase